MQTQKKNVPSSQSQKIIKVLQLHHVHQWKRFSMDTAVLTAKDVQFALNHCCCTSMQVDRKASWITTDSLNRCVFAIFLYQWTVQGVQCVFEKAYTPASSHKDIYIYQPNSWPSTGWCQPPKHKKLPVLCGHSLHSVRWDGYQRCRQQALCPTPMINP